MASSRRVAFVAPLPPPVNGFANISAEMYELLRARVPVRLFDRTRRGKGRARGLLTQLLRPYRFLGACLARHTGVLYLALSGGPGQLLDLPYLLFARLTRQRIVIHHHSFAYLIASSALNRLVFALVRQQTHIVLSGSMGVALARRYRLDPAHLIVLSNAAFYAEPPRPAARTVGTETLQGPLRLGFLSNITFDKGFVDYFGLLQELRSRQIGYRATIAGPVASDARTTFEQLLAGAAHTLYLGPLYGEAKERFYRRLDVLIFPTRYVNEADPLVVHEALRNGVYVIACDRGAIADTLAHGAGLALSQAQFIDAAASCLGRLSGQRELLAHSRQCAFQQAHRLRTAGRQALNEALANIVGQLPL